MPVLSVHAVLDIALYFVTIQMSRVYWYMVRTYALTVLYWFDGSMHKMYNVFS